MGMKQSNLYRMPRTPGYLGGYNWSATAFGCLLLVVVNFIATQYIAARFEYQPALRDADRTDQVRKHLPTVLLDLVGVAVLHFAG